MNLLSVIILLGMLQLGALSTYWKHTAIRESYSKEGDIILGGLFPFFDYNNIEHRCTTPSRFLYLKRIEAMVYAIEKVNNDNKLLPNITLGFEIRMTCGNVAVTLAESLNFVSCRSAGHSCCTAGHCDIKKRLIAGVVGANWSFCSQQAAILFGLHHMAQISYISTSDVFSDNRVYPFFLRTVAPDNFAVRVMLNIIQQYKWNYISFLNSDDTYGNSAQNQFLQLASENNICVSLTMSIARSSEEKDFENVIEKLLVLQNESYARVVILFSQFDVIKGIMRAATVKKVRRQFIWIGSDSWGATKHAASQGYEEAVLGAFTVDVFSKPLEEFNEYFRSLTPMTSDNPWLHTYLEYYGICSNSTDCKSSNLKSLDSNETKHETLVMDAVFAFAHALDAMCGEDSSLCTDADSFDRDAFLQYLLNTSFDSLANGRVSFLPNGDSAGKYSIHQLQEIDGEYKYVPVGTWSEDIGNKDVITRNVKWYLDIDNRTGAPLAACSLPCDLGEKRLINPDKPCCWSCIKCQPFEIVVDNITDCMSCINVRKGQFGRPDENYETCVDIEVRSSPWPSVIFTLSGFGLIFAAVVTSLYIYHRKNPLIKASSRDLSYVMLSGIFLAYITAILFGMVNLNGFICIIHRLGPPIATSLIYVSIAVRVIRLYRIFRTSARLKSAKLLRFIKPVFQVSLTIAITIIPIIWVIMWMIFDAAPSVEREFHQTPTYYLHVACILSTGETIGVMVWNVLIVSTCCVFAFLTRRLPENYNETKFIMFCSFNSFIVLLAFSSTYFIVYDAYYRSGYMALALIVNATITLICLCAVKIYAIYFVDIEDIKIRIKAKRDSKTDK